MFWIHGKREIGNWDGLSRLVRRWDDIEKKLEERGPGPWFMAVKDRTVEEMYIKGLE